MGNLSVSFPLEREKGEKCDFLRDTIRRTFEIEPQEQLSVDVFYSLPHAIIHHIVQIKLVRFHWA